MKIYNPATGTVITEIPEDQPGVIKEKYELLRRGQKAWYAKGLEHRVRVLEKFRDLLEQEIEQVASVLTCEVGKPLQQSRNEINGACQRIQWLSTHAGTYLADEEMTREEKLIEKIVYEPLGVIANISAWNYPLLVGVNVFVPALLAGNAVLYKPSEYATLTGIHLCRILYEAGVPDDVFQIVRGGKKAGETLLELPLDGYFFTGSYKTGKYIYEKAALKMVICQCELGGKDPLYVADDVADIKQVAAATADGAFYNNGQSCCAVERIYVHEKVYSQYLEEFIKEVKSWKVGQPMEPGVYIGPLSRKEQIAFLEAQISDAVSKGAEIKTGGKRMPGAGYYFEPTVLTQVDHTMEVMREESFGPVIGIMKVKNDEEAILKMNDSAYGLTAAVYSREMDRALNILNHMNSGSGYWNCCDRVSPALPWSGRGHSGFGATLSHAGLWAFSRPKAYHLRG